MRGNGSLSATNSASVAGIVGEAGLISDAIEVKAGIESVRKGFGDSIPDSLDVNTEMTDSADSIGGAGPGVGDLTGILVNSVVLMLLLMAILLFLLLLLLLLLLLALQ